MASKNTMFTDDNMDVWEEQIIFYRKHLDIFIEDVFYPIKLTRDQHVIARAFGNSSDIKIVQSRGSGKTWLTAICCAAICALYPGTIVAVASGTAAQATLVLQKLKMIADQNINVANELYASSAKNLVQLSKDVGKATFKNGSFIQSYAVTAMRGLRAKIIVIDECPEVDQDDIDAVISPIKNYKRDISFNYGFDDYKSKTVAITSACEKSNSFYKEFMRVTKLMNKGDKEAFVCALDYRAAAANGITDISFFMSEKERLPDLIFAMEYGSKFVGGNSDAAFPYELIQGCRSLTGVELEQPKNSMSRYVISVDLATSAAKGSDNTIISVIKFTEKATGYFTKKLVFMQSFNGKPLDFIAEEVRNLYHRRFPNCEKIVYDARGLGDSFDRFFDREWIDPSTGKEYPPLVVDDEVCLNNHAIQILHPFRAVNTLNQRLYSTVRVALEKKTIELPIPSRNIQAIEISKDNRELTMQERAVFAEADALQFEMCNIVAKIGASGNVLYDTPSAREHKDRYSSFAMALDYVTLLEEDNVKRFKQGTPCVGITGYF